jgi:hypothetical protein
MDLYEMRTAHVSDSSRDHVAADENARGAPAIIFTVIVLIAIVALFLLFKFNLFNGGATNNVHSSMAGRLVPVGV